MSLIYIIKLGNCPEMVIVAVKLLDRAVLFQFILPKETVTVSITNPTLINAPEKLLV